MADLIFVREDASSSSLTPSLSSTAASLAPSGSTIPSADPNSATTATSSSPDTVTSASATTTASGTNNPDLVTASVTFSGTALPPDASTLPDSNQKVCKEDGVKNFPPFCEPENGTTVYTGGSYYVTWFPGYFPEGTQVGVSLDFLNSSQNAWHSDLVDKNLGFVFLPIDDSMLQGNPNNSLAMSLVSNIPDQNTAANRTAGPTIVVSPPQTSQSASPVPAPSFDRKGLAIGLPIAMVVVIAVVAFLFFGMRKQRRIGLGNIMGGSRGKGYGVGKSRRQRLGLGGIRGRGAPERRGRAAAMDEFDAAMPSFRDDPDEEAAIMELNERKKRGEERYRDAVDTQANGNGTGNAFRDEINRQKKTRR